MKKKVYAITGWIYVPYDMEVEARSKKEAKEIFEKVCKYQISGWDFEPKVHEIRAGTWNGEATVKWEKEIYDREKGEDFRYNLVNNIYVGH